MGTSAPHTPIAIRTEVKPGDIGYITYLHGVLYAQEYGLDCTFEGYVAESLARFVLAFDAGKDRLWVAELDGHIVGSIGIVGASASEAQLRWFLVHPTCRGRGLGRTLLREALRFCHGRGFASIFLWTFSELQTAAQLYRSVGFRKTAHKTHMIWGKMISEERYELVLQPDPEGVQRALRPRTGAPDPQDEALWQQDTRPRFRGTASARLFRPGSLMEYADLIIPERTTAEVVSLVDRSPDSGLQFKAVYGSYEAEPLSLDSLRCILIAERA